MTNTELTLDQLEGVAGGINTEPIPRSRGLKAIPGLEWFPGLEWYELKNVKKK